jgi:hypothetical protein
MTIIDTLRTKYFQWFKAFYLTGYQWSQTRRKKQWEAKHNDKEMKKVPDPYFVEMGKVLIEMKLKTELSKMERFYFEQVMKTPAALELHAKVYEDKASKSDNISVIEAHDSIVFMTKERLGQT